MSFCNRIFFPSSATSAQLIQSLHRKWKWKELKICERTPWKQKHISISVCASSVGMRQCHTSRNIVWRPIQWWKWHVARKVSSLCFPHVCVRFVCLSVECRQQDYVFRRVKIVKERFFRYSTIHNHKNNNKIHDENSNCSLINSKQVNSEWKLPTMWILKYEARK